jgi:hypothetical protein
MKLQCSCGAKYTFDATPEMLQQPVKFICPNCGLDASDFVNQLIRQEFAGQVPPPPPASAPPPPPPAAAGPLRVSHENAPAAAAGDAPAASKFCAKHRQRATEQCSVCHKPICPKCMEMFGYFCSPLCKGKAEAQHLDVPAYAGRKDLVEAKFWRKTGLIIGVLVSLVVLFFAAWTWYAWFGSVPHDYFKVRFADDNRGYYGASYLVDHDQLVFLHGGTLARCDLKTKQQVWSNELITKQEIDNAIKTAAAEDARNNEGNGYKTHRNPDDVARDAVQELQSELTLRVSGQNVWVSNGNRMTRYDWDTGKAVRDVTLPEMGGELVESGDELQMIGAQSVTSVNLASGDSQVQQFGPGGATTGNMAQNDASGGLPGTTANIGNGTQPMDPRKVEAQAQNMNLPGRIALPAIISNARHEQQLEDALKDEPGHPRPKGKAPPADATTFQLVPGQTGFVEFGWRLLEEHFVTRSAMKGPPKKSVLDGNLNASQTGDAANEILNEMQRNAGGDTVTEDESRYQVTVHVPDASTTPDWTGEVTGPPQMSVLKTVNVIAAGKSVTVLDKSNKKLWEATLTYPVGGGGAGFFSTRESPYGQGPCVEHGDTLYVFDQAVLTSFDLNTGNARWHLPSVGVVGLFFDDKDDVIVNTTTGNPDDVKYSRQIDITRKTEPVVSKIDAKTGQIKWTVKPGGFVSYLSGKFIYVVECYDPNPRDEDVINDMVASLQKPAYLRIARIRPSDGKIMWEYYDRDRCPVNWEFNGNTIQLILKREVQVLRYLTF